MLTEEKVILAADEFNKQELLGFVKEFGPRLFAVKIHSLFDLLGPGIVEEIKQVGAKKVWVDAKLHDIPNTVRLRSLAFAKAGADILSVHISGGVKMLEAAKEGFAQGMVLGITALTSLSQEDVKNIYGTKSAEELVLKFADLAKQAGIGGLVCSPQEVLALRANNTFAQLKLAVPGIRSVGVEMSDQKRTDTPANALKAGADFLVIGRQLTKAPNPAQAFADLEAELISVNV